MPSAPTTAASVWFRVALLVTAAQVFLSWKQDEWHPHDFLLCCAMVMGTGVWVLTERHRRRLEFRRRRARIVCLHCGYDLRATPDRCPECGEVPNPHRTPHSA